MTAVDRNPPRRRSVDVIDLGDAVLASEEDLAGTRRCHTEQTGSRNRAQDAGGDPCRQQLVRAIRRHVEGDRRRRRPRRQQVEDWHVRLAGVRRMIESEVDELVERDPT